MGLQYKEKFLFFAIMIYRVPIFIGIKPDWVGSCRNNPDENRGHVKSSQTFGCTNSNILPGIALILTINRKF